MTATPKQSKKESVKKNIHKGNKFVKVDWKGRSREGERERAKKQGCVYFIFDFLTEKCANCWGVPGQSAVGERGWRGRPFATRSPLYCFRLGEPIVDALCL